MTVIAEILVAGLLLVGGFFGLVGALGLLRLPDPMTRLHAPTKSATLGVGAVLIASLLWFPIFGNGISAHELLITLFLLITAPITGHFLAKVNLHLFWKPQDLPAPGAGRVWASYAPDPDRQPATPPRDGA